MARELKVGPLYVKAVDPQARTATGIYSVFGNRDTVGDVVWPGAFSKTIQERGPTILHLWRHDDGAPPIAKITAIREVGSGELPDAVKSAAPDATGGLEVTRAYLPTPRGEEVLAALSAGIALQGSFAFDPIKADFVNAQTGEAIPLGRMMGGMSEWEIYDGLAAGTITRNLREVRLWETSDVNWGANEATVAAKSRRDLAALWAELLGELKALKSGARHSAADVKALNEIHHAVVDLGATLCLGKKDEQPAGDDADDESDDAAKSRAAILALTQQKERLMDLELYLLTR